VISRPHVAQWRDQAPWTAFYQVEQDLVISRILVEIFSDPLLCEHLAFRGGTALHKLYLHPAPRYSEDIDLVQIRPGPVKPIMQRISERITFFDEERRTESRGHGIKAIYRYVSEYEGMRMRLKLEINCKEHFNVLGWAEIPFEVKNGWFEGQCLIRTYTLNELLGTKLRALYQRSKGRDLFDLDYARHNAQVDLDLLLRCYRDYLKFSTKGRIPSQREFQMNIEMKENNLDFSGDMEALLRPGLIYDEQEAFDWLKREVLPRM